MWRAFIRTLVWMLGELDYEKSILNQKHELLSSILFVFYVTTIVGFIFNVYLLHSEAQLQQYKAKAKFHYMNSSLRLQLFVDDCFPDRRRKYARSFASVRCVTSKDRMPGEEMLAPVTDQTHDRANDVLTNLAAKDARIDKASDISDKMEQILEEIVELKEEIQAKNKKRYLHQINEDASQEMLYQLQRHRTSYIRNDYHV